MFVRSVARIGTALGIVGLAFVGAVGSAGPASAWSGLGSIPGPLQLPASVIADRGDLSDYTVEDRLATMDDYQAGKPQVPGQSLDGADRFEQIEFAWSFGWDTGSWFANDVLDLPPAEELWNSPGGLYGLPDSFCVNCDMVGGNPPGFAGNATQVGTQWTGAPPYQKSTATFNFGGGIVAPAFGTTFRNKTMQIPFGISSQSGDIRYAVITVKIYCKATTSPYAVTLFGTRSIASNDTSPHTYVGTPTGSCASFDHLEFHPTYNNTVSYPSTQPYNQGLHGAWYPVGHALYPEEVDTDPLRQIRTTAFCEPAAGGAAYQNHHYTVPFQESDFLWPVFPVTACSPGDEIVRSTLRLVFLDDPLGDGTLLAEWVKPGVPGSPAGDGGCAGCVVVLWRVDQGAAVNCFSAGDMCAGWYDDPAKDAKYDCKWGTDQLPLSDCDMYRLLFERDPPAGEDEGCDRWYTDPLTGDCSTEGDDDDDDELIGGPPPPETDCPPSFGLEILNPMWMFKAAGCAIEYAFIPDKDAVKSFTDGMTSAWNETAVGQWSGALGGMFQGLSVSEAGCSGPTANWTVAGFHIVDLQPFNACTAPMSTVAGIGKTIATASLVIFGALACVRAIGSGLGWSPGVGGGDK